MIGLLIFCYAVVCVFIARKSFVPLTPLGFCLENAVQLVVIASVTYVIYNEVRAVAIFFGAIAVLLWMLQFFSTLNYIIDPEKIYDFHFRGCACDQYGNHFNVGYIDNGISKTPVIVDGCRGDLSKDQIMVRYNDNGRKKLVSVDFFDPKLQKFITGKFAVHVRIVYI